MPGRGRRPQIDFSNIDDSVKGSRRGAQLKNSYDSEESSSSEISVIVSQARAEFQKNSTAGFEEVSGTEETEESDSASNPQKEPMMRNFKASPAQSKVMFEQEGVCFFRYFVSRMLTNAALVSFYSIFAFQESPRCVSDLG